MGGDLIATFADSEHVRAAEQDQVLPLDRLEPANLDVLRRVRAALDARPKDWARFQRQTVEFHLRNARAWANATTGEDLTLQVDPTFVIDPAPTGSATR